MLEQTPIYRAILPIIGEPDEIEKGERRIARTLYTETPLPPFVIDNKGVFIRKLIRTESKETYITFAGRLQSKIHEPAEYYGYPVKFKTIGGNDVVYIKVPIKIWTISRIFDIRTRKHRFITGCAEVTELTGQHIFNSCEEIDYFHPLTTAKYTHLFVYNTDNITGYLLLVPMSFPFTLASQTARLLAILPYGYLYQIIIPTGKVKLEHLQTKQKIIIKTYKHKLAITFVPEVMQKGTRWLLPTVLGFPIAFSNSMRDIEEELFDNFPYTSKHFVLASIIG